MTDTLYIIGNGFDLHHGVASRYADFKTYLAKHDRDLLYALENLYDCEDIWGDFEQNLLTISRETFISYVSPLFPTNEVDDEDFTYAELSFSQDSAGELVDELTENLRKRFHQWIRTLTLPAGYEKQVIKLDPYALYLSFNYTDFIETAYGATPDQICYLHGKKSDQTGSIILGHGESPENSFDNWHKANENKQRFQPRLQTKETKLTTIPTPLISPISSRTKPKATGAQKPATTPSTSPPKESKTITNNPTKILKKSLKRIKTSSPP